MPNRQTESSIQLQLEQSQCTGGVSNLGYGISQLGHLPVKNGCASSNSAFSVDVR
ncbi:MAG TPA: hypothetical protein V6D15_06775 [Oculatellaceae cyanobacterium]